MSLFALYLRNIQLFPIIDRLFGKLRKNSKKLPITELFVQMLRHMVGEIRTAYRENVTESVISMSIYDNTFRRQFIDTAGKIVRHAEKLFMKVPRSALERLQLDKLFQKYQSSLPQLC